jgi:hypothetical protein
VISRKKKIFFIQLTIFFVAIALLYTTYRNKKDDSSIAIERAEIELVQEDKLVEEEILNRNIKLRAIDLIKDKEINKNFKEINANTAIQAEQLNELNLKDIWKLTFSDDQVSQNLLKLKKQFDEASEDIKLSFEDKVIKIKKKTEPFAKIEAETNPDTNSFVDIEYSGFDLTGNRYILEAGEATFETKTPQLINMKKVEAKFYLKDDTILTVTSDKGLYNNISLDMNFIENVKADYLTHVLLSDLLSYSNSNAKLIATGNVRGESIEKGKFSADNVEYDLAGKNLNFSMFGDKQVNVKLKN